MDKLPVIEGEFRVVSRPPEPKVIYTCGFADVVLAIFALLILLILGG